MQKVLADAGLTHEFILDGNIDDLTDTVLETTFSGPMQRRRGSTSCAYKHLLACRRIVELKIPRALILEDDIIMLPAYRKTFSLCLEELHRRSLNNCIISLENSGHVFIRRSERTPGTLLYKKNKGRCAGAYLIDLECAQSILRYVEDHRVGEAIDWFHNRLFGENIIDCYWLEPPVFEQSSNNGRMASLLELNKKHSFLKMLAHDIRCGARRLVSHIR
jgi:glycosyl transferase family 25